MQVEDEQQVAAGVLGEEDEEMVVVVVVVIMIIGSNGERGRGSVFRAASQSWSGKLKVERASLGEG